GVWSFDPAPPLVMHTVTISLPARAHLASVPPTVNSWSSGCAWMLITRLGAGGSRRAVFAGLARSGTSGAAGSASGSWAVMDYGSRCATEAQEAAARLASFAWTCAFGTAPIT